MWSIKIVSMYHTLDGNLMRKDVGVDRVSQKGGDDED
jgi:hypothetical protein